MNNLIIIDDSACKDELNEFINKYSRQIKLLLSEEDYHIDLDSMVDKIKGDFAEQKIVFIATKNDILKLSVKNILFIKSDENGVFITLNNGQSHELTKSLIHYKINLKFNDIIQVNNNCLVNMKSVNEYSFEDHSILLGKSHKVNVSAEYREQVFNAINKFEN